MSKLAYFKIQTSPEYTDFNTFAELNPRGAELFRRLCAKNGDDVETAYVGAKYGGFSKVTHIVVGSSRGFGGRLDQIDAYTLKTVDEGGNTEMYILSAFNRWYENVVNNGYEIFGVGQLSELEFLVSRITLLNLQLSNALRERYRFVDVLRNLKLEEFMYRYNVDESLVSKLNEKQDVSVDELKNKVSKDFKSLNRFAEIFMNQ